MLGAVVIVVGVLWRGGAVGGGGGKKYLEIPLYYGGVVGCGCFVT